MKHAELHGIFPPILTPFTSSGEVDHPSLTRLVEYLLGEGVHGMWACGTTGEFACLNADERAGVVETVVKTVRGRVPVVANVGDCSTRQTLVHARNARAAGADYLAATPPYYYSNSQDELLDFYRSLRQAVDLPLLVYNIPQTVKVKLDVGTMVTLAAEGTIVGYKDSQNDLEWVRQVMQGVAARGAELRAFAGTRNLIDASLIAGAHGAIPGVSNIAAAACVACYESARSGDFVAARRHADAIGQAFKVGSVGRGSQHSASFSGMKAALKAAGIIETAVVAPPLRTVTAEEEARIAELAAEIGLRPKLAAAAGA